MEILEVTFQFLSLVGKSATRDPLGIGLVLALVCLFYMKSLLWRLALGVAKLAIIVTVAITATNYANENKSNLLPKEQQEESSERLTDVKKRLSKVAAVIEKEFFAEASLEAIEASQQSQQTNAREQLPSLLH